MSIAPPPEASEDARRLLFYRNNPAKWAEHHLDIELSHCRERAELEAWLEHQPKERHQWIRNRLQADDPTLQLGRSRKYQAEWLNAIATPGWYAFQCCNGGRKTASAAIACLWFLDNFPGGRCVTTAGTWSQLREQLWREIPTWAAKATLPIAPNSVPMQRTQINLGPDWVAFGRAASAERTFEGVHGRYVMIIMDEAKAIKPEVYDAVRRIQRGDDRSAYWVVMLSSPGTPDGPFWEHTNGDYAGRTTTFRLSAYECGHISLDQIAVDNQDLGDDSPLYISMVVGEHPDIGEATIIPLSHAQAAASRNHLVSGNGARFLGVDVARFGSSETVLFESKGRQTAIVDSYVGRDTNWTIGAIRTAYRERGPYRRILIDDTGVGGGVVDQLVAEDKNRRGSYPITPILFGSRKTRRPDVYHDVRTEMWFMLAAALKEGAENYTDPEKGLGIPNDKRLISQLTAPRYKYTTSGSTYVMESKDDLRDRGLPSPDRADGLVMANYGRTGPTKGSMRALPHDVNPPA